MEMMAINKIWFVFGMFSLGFEEEEKEEKRMENKNDTSHLYIYSVSFLYK